MADAHIPILNGQFYENNAYKTACINRSISITPFIPPQLVNNSFIKRLSITGIKTSKAFPDIQAVKCGTCIDSQCKNSAVGGSFDT